MKFLDASEHLDELAALNASHADRQIEAVPGTGGTMLVNANLLEDSSGYWLDYSEWLASLPQTDATPVVVPFAPF